MAQSGYLSLLTPARSARPSLAAAASKDPYGLAPNNRSGPLGVGSSTGFAAPPPAPRSPGYTQGQVQSSLAANPYASHGGYEGPVPMPAQYTPPTAAAVNSYDLNTDPALQTVQALAGLSDEQAQSGALQQRENLLLAYGDPNVASSVLGPNDPIAQAAGQNPTGTVQQLGQQKDRNLKTLDDQLNAANLGYSGYRVTQETQAGQDYQNALAQAAGQLNSNLGTVDSNLASVLSQNNAQRVSGINDAADREAAYAAQNGVDPGAVGPLAGAASGGGGGAGGEIPNAGSPLDPVTQAVLAWASGALKGPSVVASNGLAARQARQNFSGIGV